MSYNKLPYNLPMLQNLIKRDPSSYIEEFDRQYQMFKGMKEILELQPSELSSDFIELVTFIAQVSQCYKEKLITFPEDIVSILHRHGPVLHASTRMTLVKALILMKNKNLLGTRELLELFFKLLRSPDKNLRKFIKTSIITDVVNNNANKKNASLNNDFQNYMSEMLTNNHAVAIKTALDILISLYKKNVWNDVKTVNIIVNACFCKIVKVMVAALKFFVGIDIDGDDESGSDDDTEEKVSKVKHALKVNITSRKRENKLKKSRRADKKMNKKKGDKKPVFDFSAIHLIHDPQKLAENLYKKLEKFNERFEVKLMIMNFLSRLIGLHELYLPNFYAYLQRYLFVQQRDVTKIMVFLAQAAHQLVPPEDLEPLVRTLADNFVTDRYRGEVMAMGINAIRELCARNNFCMTEDLLMDLSLFKSHKDKAVNLATASLICLFRENNPGLLAKRFRGVPTELSVETETMNFGETDAKSYIPGAELLYYTDTKDDDSWVNMSDSDDSDTENDPRHMSRKLAKDEVMKLTVDERAEKATDIVCSRALTDEDFAAIRKLQDSKKKERFSKSRKAKGKKRIMEDEEIERGQCVTLKSIEMVHKKRKHDKLARMETTLAGREDKPKYGARKGRIDPYASTTNKEKKKTKNFMMVKHKIHANTTRRSFRDRLETLRSRLRKKMK